MNCVAPASEIQLPSKNKKRTMIVKSAKMWVSTGFYSIDVGTP